VADDWFAQNAPQQSQGDWFAQNAPSAVPSGAQMSATPLAEQSGALPALHRGMQQLTQLPGNIYHAIVDDPKDADEQARAEVTSAAMPANVPPRLAMIYNRLFLDPQLAASRKAEQFQQESNQARSQGDNDRADRLQYAANVHREGSYVPVVGPWVADVTDRRFGLSTGTPDPYAYLEYGPALATEVAGEGL